MQANPTTPTIRGQINSRYEMLRASYKFLNPSKCKACGQPIEWWLTTRGSKIPFNPIANYEVQTVAHRETCTRRGPATTAPSYTPVARSADQLAALQREVEALCGKYDLRAVLLLHNGGRVYNYRRGIPGEDLRSEIISAANEIRAAIAKGEK